MPLAVAELKLVVGSEGGHNRAVTIVNFELNGAVDHVEEEVVPAALDGGQVAGQIPWLDHHVMVMLKSRLQTDHELSLGPDSASFRSKEEAGLYLF